MLEQFRSASNCAQMDPIVYISAMAAVTKSVCFGITGSTSYINASRRLEGSGIHC
jgi:alkanesulfonate monooxygenase SsuD/methylene tetrahydromethanopterin reductase-like flavin-dependent oxidoreductase (luciferase family)